MTGLLITFEGIEGSGKSTQIDLLRKRIEAMGLDVKVTREPGGTGIGEAVRSILLNPANKAMAPMTELLLYEAARSQLVAECFRPWLDGGAVVLCDRFFDSTTAYQGGGRGLGGSELESLHAMATQGLRPQLTLLIDLPPEEGLSRARRERSLDRIEQESIEFHNRVRQGYLDLARSEPHRIKVIDGLREPEPITKEIFAYVEPLLSAMGTGS